MSCKCFENEFGDISAEGCPDHDRRDVPCSARLLNETLASERREPVVVGLTTKQVNDLLAISDRWNRDRATRQLRALSDNEVLTKALETLRGLICGKDG